MRVLKHAVSLALAMFLLYACTLRLDHSGESKTVEVKIACAMDTTVSGSKAVRMINDPCVLSVKVFAQDSSGTVLGNAVLTKGDSSWTGSMNITVTEEDMPVAFNARGYSGEGATGNILDYGKIDVVVSPSDVSLSVFISTALQQTAQWAKTVGTGSTIGSSSSFYGVSVDSSGNAYAAGVQYGWGDYTYGDGVISSARSAPEEYNVVLVKYGK